MRSKTPARRVNRPRLELLEARTAPAVAGVDDIYYLGAGGTLAVPGGQNILAESGFNDEKGIHSDPTPGSPYQLEQTIQGRGLTEPGWTRSWVVSAGGCACGEHRGLMEPVPVYEGDGAVHAYGASDGTWLHRGFEPQYDLFLLEQRVRLPANADMGARPSGYGAQPHSFGPVWTAANGRFRAHQGDGQGGSTPIDTGIAVVPLYWHKVSLLIDAAQQTYEFYVDGVKFDAGVPLRFRGNPFSIYNVDYLGVRDYWLDAVSIRNASRGALQGVLQNDITSAEGPLAAQPTGKGPEHGELKFQEDGGFVYTPMAGFSGTDAFTYVVLDGEGNQATGTVTIIVSPPPPLPIAVDDAYQAVSGTTLIVGGGGNYQTVAQSGFNDGLGFNADRTPDSPYQFGESIHGRGPEPGWANNWTVSDGGCACGEHLGRADGGVPWEGDGALHVRLSQNPGGTWVHRQWAEAQFGRFILEQRVALPAGSWLGSRPYGPGGFGPVWGVLDSRFVAYQGDGAGGVRPIDTGIVAEPLVWHHVAMVVDVASQTYEFFVDGQQFQHTEPLRFRERPSSISNIDYLAGSEVWIDAVRMISLDENPVLGVLLNDESLTGGFLSATLLDGPKNGTLSFGSNGGFRYTPHAGFVGVDTFTYRASDGTWESEPATVTIEVFGEKPAPRERWAGVVAAVLGDHRVELITLAPGSGPVAARQEAAMDLEPRTAGLSTIAEPRTSPHQSESSRNADTFTMTALDALFALPV